MGGGGKGKIKGQNTIPLMDQVSKLHTRIGDHVSGSINDELSDTLVQVVDVRPVSKGGYFRWAAAAWFVE